MSRATTKLSSGKGRDGKESEKESFTSKRKTEKNTGKFSIAFGMSTEVRLFPHLQQDASQIGLLR